MTSKYYSPCSWHSPKKRAVLLAQTCNPHANLRPEPLSPQPHGSFSNGDLGFGGDGVSYLEDQRTYQVACRWGYKAE